MSDALTPGELAALCRITTPTVCNAIEALGVRPANEGFMDRTITCRFPELPPVAGYAVTVKIKAAERPASREIPPWEVWERVAGVPRPWFVVVEDLDYPEPAGAFWGEVHAAIYKGLGAVAAVTNGGVRDLSEVRATGFQFFSSCVLVSHAYLHVVEAGAPVKVGGLTVSPGDLLHGDLHGVTSVPLEVARNVPRVAAEISEREGKIIEYARSAECSIEGLREVVQRYD